jgi:thioester reductase-like protein
MMQCHAKPEKPFLVTGATGFIGSHLAGALAEAGHSLCLLIRALPTHNTTSADRWNRIADWLSLSAAARARIRVIAGDLDAPDLNLSADDARFLKGNTEEIVHAAASTLFSEKNALKYFEPTSADSKIFFLSWRTVPAAAFMPSVRPMWGGVP